MKRLFNNEWNEWNESACLESMNAGVHRMKRIWQRHKRCLCRQFCLIRRTLAFIVLFTSFVIFSTFVVNNIAFKWKCRAEWSEFNKDTQYVMIGSFVSFAERLRSLSCLAHSLHSFHSLFNYMSWSADWFHSQNACVHGRVYFIRYVCFIRCSSKRKILRCRKDATACW